METNIFPLYEIEDGIRYTINHRPRARPVEDYLSVQGRYRHLAGDQINAVQAEVDRSWEDLEYRAARAG